MDIQALLRHAADEPERLLLRRLLDLDRRAEDQWHVCATPFLRPEEQALCARVAPHLRCALSFDGGFADAERRLALLCPREATEYLLPDATGDLLCALALHHKEPLTHRDILGSLLGLGLRRDAVGDILVGDACTTVLLQRSVYDFVRSTLTRAGRVPLTLEDIAFCDILPPEQQVHLVQDTVASLRFDAVLAAAFSLSREQAQQAIARGLAHLGDRPTLSPSKAVAAGDVFSLRGHGKARLQQIGGQSRKGRTHITIARYV